MASQRIQDAVNMLRRNATLFLAMGLVAIGVGLANLLLLPDLRAFGALFILKGILFLSCGTYFHMYAQGLAQRRPWALRGLERKPSGLTGWLGNKRNFILLILMAVLLGILLSSVLRLVWPI